MWPSEVIEDENRPAKETDIQCSTAGKVNECVSGALLVQCILGIGRLTLSTITQLE